tara:strand:+ start:274 stop:642 length:369 start_codon:yes stop_codon:yes gene_type:complete
MTSLSSFDMTFDPINRALNIETMQIEETPSPPTLYVRGTKKQKQYVIKGCPRPGRGCSYPWKDPSYDVGDWFWKPVSPNEWKSNHGRPNVPPSKSIGGRVWRTSKAYREDTKQHGYFVERVA